MRAVRGRGEATRLHLRQRLLQVGDQIADRLQADRQPDVIRGDAGRRLLLLGLSCECVVLAGWMTSDFASPMFARCENSLTDFDEGLAGLLARP